MKETKNEQNELFYESITYYKDFFECPTNSFYCNITKICINAIQRCDSIDHCANGEDEINCKVEFLFHCSSVQNISVKKLCNFFNDCENGEDERNCC